MVRGRSMAVGLVKSRVRWMPEFRITASTRGCLVVILSAVISLEALDLLGYGWGALVLTL